MANNRFIITGCSGGGKSTLLDELHRRGHATMPEPGRAIVREEMAGDGSALPWVSLEKFAERAVALSVKYYLQASALSGPVFFDRSLLDATAALERAGLSGVDRLQRLIGEHRYEPTVFVAPPWPELFETDAERQHDFAAAVDEYEHLCRYYPAHGYELIELPKTSVSERADFIVSRAVTTGLRG